MQLLNTENIRVENKSLEEYKSSVLGGYGIRVIIDGAIGYSSSSVISSERLSTRQ
jgi:predicted Zn-dependent protease